jgi:anti-anti-sigma factor
MEITVSHEQGRVPVTVLHIAGEVGAMTYLQLQDAAQQAIDGGARDLLLDLTATRYISSAGLRALNAIFVALRDASGENPDLVGQGLRDGIYRSPHLKLLSLSPDVARVLNTAGFDMFLDSYGDLRSAVASF